MSYAKLLSRLKVILTVIIIICLLVFVIFPSINVLAYVIFHWKNVYEEVFNNPYIGDTYWREIQKYLSLSFRISLTAVVIDLILGIPLSYILARKKFPGKSIIEDLVTLTLVLPTSGFGFAVLLAWSRKPLYGNFIIPIINVPFLILLVHVALTLPYVVKTLTATLRSLEESYEIVSRSLGARTITTFRKVTLPMILPSLVSCVTLALTRSLGETGATLVVAGINVTASIAIVRWVFEFKMGPATFIATLLIIICLALLLPAEKFSKRRVHLQVKNLDKVLLKIERKVPKLLGKVALIFIILIFVFIILYPISIMVFMTLRYWQRDPYTGRIEGGIMYQLFGPPAYFYKILNATITSLVVSTLSTFISTFLALCLVFIIVNYRWGTIIRGLLKIPLVIPTSALGLSSLLYWSSTGLVGPSVWLTILTHITFSVPIILETTLSTYESINISTLEDVARTLGASPYDVIETISIPLLKRGILAGAVLAFAHSLGETGATFLVMGKDVTVSVLVVNLVESLAIPAALFTSLYLTLISLALLIIVRFITREY